MRINESTLRRYIRTLLEADPAETPGLEVTDAEQAAKEATTTPQPEQKPEEPKPGEELSLSKAIAQTLARRMRRDGAVEQSVTDMMNSAEKIT